MQMPSGGGVHSIIFAPPPRYIFPPPLTGQAGMFALQGGIVGEARIVERAFALGPCALTEAMALLQDRLANAET